MKKIQISLLCMLLAFGSYAREANNFKNKQFVIVIPSRNNSPWCERNLNSVLIQKNSNWRAIYINDASTDDTGVKVAEFISKHGLQNKITLINNEVRKGALANIVGVVHACADWERVVLLDGDDWLSDSQVLQKLDDVYLDENVWMTYGTYQEYPSGNRGEFVRPIPARVVASSSYRKYTWCTSHLRSFYAWLFKLIKIEDFKVGDTFLPMAWDLAMMFPMLEMSGGRFKYISDILYIYNLETPFNDHKIDPTLPITLGNIIRARPAYQALKQVPTQYLQRK